MAPGGRFYRHAVRRLLNGVDIDLYDFGWRSGRMPQERQSVLEDPADASRELPRGVTAPASETNQSKLGEKAILAEVPLGLVFPGSWMVDIWLVARSELFHKMETWRRGAGAMRQSWVVHDVTLVTWAPVTLTSNVPMGFKSGFGERSANNCVWGKSPYHFWVDQNLPEKVLETLILKPLHALTSVGLRPGFSGR